MATEADSDNKKTDDPMEIETAQGKPATQDFSPSERAFLDEVSAPWREADVTQHRSPSPRPRRRITH